MTDDLSLLLKPTSWKKTLMWLRSVVKVRIWVMMILWVRMGNTNIWGQPFAAWVRWLSLRVAANFRDSLTWDRGIYGHLTPNSSTSATKLSLLENQLTFIYGREVRSDAISFQSTIHSTKIEQLDACWSTRSSNTTMWLTSILAFRQANNLNNKPAKNEHNNKKNARECNALIWKYVSENALSASSQPRTSALIVCARASAWCLLCV